MDRTPCIPAVCVALLLVGCAADSSPAPSDAHESTRDPHSFARPSEVVVEHLVLDITVDFERRSIDGTVALDIDNRSGAAELWLDTRDLDIRAVRLGDGSETAYRLGDPEPFLGRPLVVEITPGTKRVQVDYASRPEAAALQWLEPAQTAGGEHPFLLSQSQAILARTWVPCQDTPAVRVTYEAVVRVPPGLMALMSAENPTENTPDGIYRFRMPQPIPSYLLALAVGRLEFRSLGPRSGVYAEPNVIDRAAWEFAETEPMIDSAEALYGPYRWERYDMVVLPSSFPFGGMENPRLTFVTPTVLAGDRSLVSLIAHELAHSWSGNLVTNATWNDFWLNEGFTVYFEYRIMEQLYGREYAEMLAQLGNQDLQEQFEDLGPDSADTHLYLDLAGRDPDDGSTWVPYEKGYLFLRALEEAVGRERFDVFLRGYFDRNGFRSMTTSAFLEYLRKELVRGDAELERRLQIDAWVYGPGLPDNSPLPRSDEFLRVEEQLRVWTAGETAARLETGEWSTHHWLHFVRGIPETVPVARLAELDAEFDLSGSGNSEILHAWLMQAVRHGYDPAYGALETFLTGMGRNKFLTPLYTALAATPRGLERGRRIYEQARPRYHPLSTAAVDPILGWPWSE